MKRVVITGGTGFVGANLVRWLTKQGHQVHLIVRQESKMWRVRDVLEQVQLHYIDYTDLEEVRSLFREIQPEWLFHLAAYGAYPYRNGAPYQQDIGQMVRTNVVGTMVLIKCSSECGVEVFINTGSSSEYGMKNAPMSETDVLMPNDNYGASKAAAGLMALTASQNSSMRFFHIRLFSVYGPYEEPTRLIPTVMVGHVTESSLCLANPASVRDFIYVDDVLEAMGFLINSSERSGIFNLGTGEQHSVRDVVELTSKASGFVPEVVWGSINSKPNEPKTWVANIGELRTLGWEPRFTLSEGLAATYQWFQLNAVHYTESARS